MRKFLADFKKSREGVLSKIDLEKIFHLLQRELQGYGPVQVPVLDDNVEDISCVGPNAFEYYHSGKNYLYQRYGAQVKESEKRSRTS